MPPITKSTVESSKSSLGELRKQVKEPKRTGPLWKGPEVDGVTFSMLSRFLVCRERFRLYAIQGLRTADQFNHRIEYGQMWHTCEEHFAKSGNPIVKNPVAEAPWLTALRKYAMQKCKEYPTQQEHVQHWYEVCKLQFPIYVDFWKRHKDITSRTPLLQEQVFDVPYKLPSGRTVRLRGKWDSVDLVGKGNDARIWLMENKSKGNINELQLRRQLSFDLQTMMYLVSLDKAHWCVDFGKDTYRTGRPAPIAGVRYNVIRRPLSGGKGNIKRSEGTKGSKCSKCKEAKVDKNGERCVKCNGVGRINAKPEESKEEYYARVAKYITDEPQEYFMRWNVLVNQRDIAKFRKECLDPILEQLCDWYSWIAIQSKNNNPFSPNDGCENSFDGSVRSWIHWRHPFGCYNVLDEGGASDLDEYLATGSELGLRRVDRLFTELEQNAPE